MRWRSCACKTKESSFASGSTYGPSSARARPATGARGAGRQRSAGSLLDGAGRLPRGSSYRSTASRAACASVDQVAIGVDERCLEDLRQRFRVGGTAAELHPWLEDRLLLPVAGLPYRRAVVSVEAREGAEAPDVR